MSIRVELVPRYEWPSKACAVLIDSPTSVSSAACVCRNECHETRVQLIRRKSETIQGQGQDLKAPYRLGDASIGVFCSRFVPRLFFGDNPAHLNGSFFIGTGPLQQSCHNESRLRRLFLTARIAAAAVHRSNI